MIGRILPPLEQQVKYRFVRYCRGYGLDVGYGKGTVFENAVGVRPKGDVGACVPNITVGDLTRLDDVIPESCHFIVAADVFPRTDDAPAAVADWLSRVKPDGYVCIYEPTSQSSVLLAIALSVRDTRIDVVALDNWGEGSYIVLQKRDGSFRAMGSSYLKAKAEKSCLFVRHGGIGDQLQAAYLLPQLKREGYHITFLTSPQGREIVERDPHIDEWFMVDKDQVPNGELVPFWTTIAKDYDKFVNLNESCEGALLTIPGRPSHLWPQEVRHRLFNRNYAEFAAMLAEIPFVPEGRFYPSPEETVWCTKFMQACADAAKIDQPFFIMWVLAGSSPHKFTPHQDTVLKMIFGSLPSAMVIMVGNEAGKILEAGWENEPRVVRTSGEMSIRHTLAMARMMNVVIGPETGVLNSVCYERIPAKVIMLSHSSDENLTKHWINSHIILGNAPCYPCHRLHYTAEYCPQDPETHAAVCQQNVDPRLIYAPIENEYLGWDRARLVKVA